MSTKQDLLNSYLSLGVERGFDNISLQNLADELSIKKSSIFSHYNDYSELKNQAIQSCLDSIEAITFEINPKAQSVEILFLELINSFIDAFTVYPVNALLNLIDQKRTYDDYISILNNKIDLMISSRFQVALDYCFQRSWTNIENSDEVAKLLTSYLRTILIKKSISDDDLSDMLQMILNLL